MVEAGESWGGMWWRVLECFNSVKEFGWREVENSVCMFDKLIFTSNM